MSLWQFVLPRNQVTLFADDTWGLGMPLERESQPLPHSVSWARGGGFSGPRLWLEHELLFELLLFGWSMNYYCSFVSGARVWFFSISFSIWSPWEKLILWFFVLSQTRPQGLGRKATHSCNAAVYHTCNNLTSWLEMLLSKFSLGGIIYSCGEGGLTLAGCHMPTKMLYHSSSSSAGKAKSAYQLLSRTKQT